MNVSSILRRKGTHVETARGHMTVREAAQRLTEKRIGSLVVLNCEQDVLGLLSEHDLVRALSDHGPACWDMPIADLADERPATCNPEDELGDVLSLMTRRRARHIPVTAGEALIGIISIGDVVKHQLEDLTLELAVLRDSYYARGAAN